MYQTINVFEQILLYAKYLIYIKRHF